MNAEVATITIPIALAFDQLEPRIVGEARRLIEDCKQELLAAKGEPLQKLADRGELTWRISLIWDEAA